MIELSRSKKTYLGKTDDGRNRWSLDCSIAPIVMREPDKDWEDIKPEFVIEGNKRISKGTPYKLELDSLGNRRIYPDRTDLTKYLEFPAPAMISGLTKTWESKRCVAKAANEDFVFGLDSVAATFSVLFKAKPAFKSITFNVNPVGFDVAEHLKPDSVPRIPRPRLIDSSPEPIERFLATSSKASPIRLPFMVRAVCMNAHSGERPSLIRLPSMNMASANCCSICLISSLIFL